MLKKNLSIYQGPTIHEAAMTASKSHAKMTKKKKKSPNRMQPLGEECPNRLLFKVYLSCTYISITLAFFFLAFMRYIIWKGAYLKFK